MYTGCLNKCRAKWHYILIIAMISITTVFAVTVVAESDTAEKSVPRNKVRRLRYIDGASAKEMLTQLNIGRDINILPNNNKILVITANSSTELRRANTLLDVIDSKQKYTMQTVLTSPQPDTIPDKKQIAQLLPDFIIGTFNDPPINTEGSKILIDMLGADMVLIAPATSIEMIAEKITKLHQPTEKQETAQPDETKPEEKTKLEKIADDFMDDPLLQELANAVTDAAVPEKPEPAAEPKVTPAPEKEPEPTPTPAKDTAPKAEPKTAEPVDPKEDGANAMLEALKAIAAMEAKQPQPAAPDATKPPTSPSISDTAAGVDPGEEELETIITLPQKVEIIKLIELVGKQLKLNYIYDPKIISGEVLLKIHDGKIKVKDIYKLLESVLKFKKFVMTRRGNLVTIVKETDASTIDPIIRRANEKIEDGNVTVATIFQLKHIDTASAANLLKNMKLGIGNTEQIKDTNTIIVTGYAYRMPRIEKLISMVDVAGEPKFYEFRQLKFTIATNLVPKIKTLSEQLGTVSISIGATATAAPRTPTRTTGRTTRPITPTTKTSATKNKQGAFLDVDERTNRILMIGRRAELDVINSLIDSLDVQQQDLRAIRQYEIENVGAEEVESTLSQLGIIGKSSSSPRGSISAPRSPSTSKTTIPRSTTTKTSSSGDALEDQPQVVVLEATNSLLVNATPEQHDQIVMIIAHVDTKLEVDANPYVIYSLENQDPEMMAETLTKVIKETTKTSISKDPKVQASTKTGDDEVIIVPDSNTFSLIVYASRKNQEQIAQLIDVLDRRRPQVLIDATLVEISKDDSFEYDLNLVSSFPNMDHTSGIVDSVTDITASAIDGLLDAADDRSRLLETSSVSGSGKAFYADNHIQALLTLMQTNGYGRVLAQPKVLVNDNETGTINSDKTRYIARQSSTGSTGDNTLISQSTTFDEFTSGINLEITPHISEGDLLRLEINLARSLQEAGVGSQTIGDNSVAVPPDRTENNVTTIVTVPDKSTIILGGVQQLNQSKDTSKVPLLGDLPLIGGLFRSIDTTDSQTKLYIFVKANILRPEGVEGGLQELVDESNLYRKAYEDAEADWQKKETWPGIKPKIVKPEKFLDVR